jgi:hypothetical protein
MALALKGCPTFSAWLDFQDAFGGYVEVIGEDVALWGVMHDAPQWLTPNRVEVEREGQSSWRIACADVHPSYDYWLDKDGQFLSLGGGGRYRSFGVKVERDAVFWESSSRGRTWELDFTLFESVGNIERLLNGLNCEKIQEASDEYSTLYKSHDVIFVARGNGATIWIASDARQLVTSSFQSAR